MKSLHLSLMMVITVLASTFTIGNAEAATVLGASVDANRKLIKVNVQYGGGCKEHKFRLEQVQGCLETYPVMCELELVDETQGDYCEALIGKTLVFSFAQLGFNNSYYSQAMISIKGDLDSKATIRLPIIK